AVQTAQNKALLDFVKQHADELDKPRLAAIQKHAPKLFSDWLTHFTEKTAMVNQAEHRDHVIFPSLVTGVGYHLEASVKGTRYPCVYEDGEGGIYFLLPNATKTFTMHGRSLAGGGSFPANFTVHVEGTKEAPATSKKKSQGKTKEEREAENQGMNPDLHKPKSDPNKDMSAPDSEAAALKGGLGNLLAPGSRASNTKAKTPRQTKMEMMDDADMPDDAMPGKPKSKSAMPLKGDKTKDGMMKGEMPEDDGEMMEKPKVKAKK
ncbi:MAG: family finger-like protein, partial [Planctomycetaceae bacterium]|nr:family finger-like protein [Planctomycetaceae bacterium]